MQSTARHELTRNFVVFHSRFATNLYAIVKYLIIIHVISVTCSSLVSGVAIFDTFMNAMCVLCETRIYNLAKRGDGISKYTNLVFRFRLLLLIQLVGHATTIECLVSYCSEWVAQIGKVNIFLIVFSTLNSLLTLLITYLQWKIIQDWCNKNQHMLLPGDLEVSLATQSPGVRQENMGPIPTAFSGIDHHAILLGSDHQFIGEKFYTVQRQIS